MGYTNYLKPTQGYLSYVQPFQDQLPTRVGTVLVITVDRSEAGSCSFQWRNFLHHMQIKKHYRVLTRNHPRDIGLANIIIQYVPKGVAKGYVQKASLAGVETVVNPQTVIKHIKLAQEDVDETDEVFQDVMKDIRKVAAEEKEKECSLPEEKEEKKTSTIISKMYGVESEKEEKNEEKD